MRLALKLAAVTVLSFVRLVAPAYAQFDDSGLLYSMATAPSSEDDLNESWRRFNHSTQHDSIIQKTTSELARRTFPECKDFKRPNGYSVNVAIYKPVSFDEDKPVSGAWHESFTLNACGNKIQDNLFFTVPTRSSISVTIGVPGSTLTSGTLQEAAKTEVKDAARIEDVNCTKPVVTNTEFLKTPTTSQHRWDEIWTYSGCGGVQQMNVHFTQDGTRQVIRAGSDKIR